MWWVARENWTWLLLAALLGAAVTTWLSTRRVAPAEPLPPREPVPRPTPVAVTSPAPSPAPGPVHLAVPAEPDPAPPAAPPAADPPAPVPVVPAQPALRVKAKRSSMLFHTERSPNYARLGADEWFATEDDARAAGFSRWDDPDRPRPSR